MDANTQRLEQTDEGPDSSILNASRRRIPDQPTTLLTFLNSICRLAGAGLDHTGSVPAALNPTATFHQTGRRPVPQHLLTVPGLADRPTA